MDDVRYVFKVFIKRTGICLGTGDSLESADKIIADEECQKHMKGDFESEAYEIIKVCM